MNAVLVAVALAVARAVAPGTSAPEDPLLRALVDEALVRNPDLLAAQEGLSAARERAAQAGTLPDPNLSVAYTNDGWPPSLGTREMTTLAFVASQDLPWFGKRGLRSDIASRETDQIAQQVARARLRTEAEVKRAYYGLLLARQLLGITGEQRDLWREIEGVVRSRYAVGQGAQQDVLRIQVEITRVEQGAAEQAAEADVRLAELNRLLARPPDAPLGTSASLAVEPLALPLAEAIEKARQVSPELASARLAVERGRLAAELARKEYKPDLSVQAGYMNRGGLDPMWQAGVGITLPVQRRRRAAAVAEADALTRTSERLVEAVGLQLRYRTQERFTRLRSTEKIVDLYAKGIVPQDRMSVEAALANYRSGRVPFIAVLESLQTLYADRATLARLGADHARLQASLEEASLEANADMSAAGSPAPLAAGSSGGAAMGGGMGGR
ncbi:MAG TPA: TolC family protein [Vicinamibacteria bacterium]|nr:TolC family protein [Vicinamibacteria bacterium]